ncbi:tetratricopeptide repeat protein [Fructobacillus sp. M1-13]|uniref:Tetratricopeptide repeat protein n=1 Tax=Fructobacillus papyriferae TaxID=2713171 RepID=A0ABS5QRM7_9LACO|nr:tetratricopeptide repeat protein [Fructobacillus papyriferae]MBS9335056.1 tetratricopeptide repeat protein [Fructobacillus papyriferae]MCD2159458.1 tetratricopeptide repeat protein [Fructobacillus papyriferae]
MNFKEYIGQYEKVGLAELQEVPAFFTRLKLARRVLNGDNDIDLNRSLSTPHYLSDLGVRRLSDGQKYAELVAAKFEMKLPETDALVDELLAVPINRLKYWLDIVVLLTGNYEALEQVVRKRLDEISQENDFLLFLYSATILSANQDPGFRELFTNASRLENVTTEQRLVLLHRIAVSELKRMHDVEKFKGAIAEILASYQAKEYEASLLVTGLIDNLFGLYLIKEEGNNATLELTMINADIVLNVALERETDDERRDMILRYLGQVALNRAQVYLLAQQHDRARKILQHNLERNVQHDSEYIAETLGALAALEYKSENYQTAIENGRAAIENYRLFGNVTAMKSVYKILLASYNKLGDFEKTKGLALALKENHWELYL